MNMKNKLAMQVPRTDPTMSKEENEVVKEAEIKLTESEIERRKLKALDQTYVSSLITPPTRVGDWFLTHIIGKGTFSTVFLGRNIPTEQYYAVKLEPRLSSINFTSHEVVVLRSLGYPKELPHIPKCVEYVNEKTISYLAMTLLGDNLRDLKIKSPEKKFLRGTWSRIGIQILYAIKLVHDKGFIHRDVKPENLMMGAEEDEKRWRIVHLIDFGLARQWAWSTGMKGQTYARPMRKKAPFRGSLCFASPNVHLCFELGRRDDLWSLLYVLVYLNDHLPWEHKKDQESIFKGKMSPNTFLSGMPSNLRRVVANLLKTSALERPNYHLFFNVLWNIMTKSGDTPKSKFSFEDNDLTDREIKSRKVGDWEDPNGTFFSEEPLNINGPEHCFKKKKEWENPKVDIFQDFNYDVAESQFLVENAEKLKKMDKKCENVRTKSSDETKQKLYYEYRAAQPVPSFGLVWDGNIAKLESTILDAKLKGRARTKEDARNHLAEKLAEGEFEKLLNFELKPEDLEEKSKNSNEFKETANRNMNSDGDGKK